MVHGWLTCDLGGSRDQVKMVPKVQVISGYLEGEFQKSYGHIKQIPPSNL
jgi:hypothetical protein